MNKSARPGICRLTGSSGLFVKSHIIPKALTPKSEGNSLLFQTDGENRPTKRRDSWYDYQLVTREGEDILERIDDDAIKELRRLKLAWKYWENTEELGMEPVHYGSAIGVRHLLDVDHNVLGRFAVSLLWRAGISVSPDMKMFRVPRKTLSRARKVVLGVESFDPQRFPIKVFQFASKGPMHNITPMNHELVAPNGKYE